MEITFRKSNGTVLQLLYPESRSGLEPFDFIATMALRELGRDPLGKQGL